MGLFGFGRKKREAKEAQEAEDLEKADKTEDAAEDADEQEPQTPAFPPAAADTYVGRGEQYGPWDVNDENVPDYDEYLDMGSYYLPFLLGIQLRIKANRKTGQVLGATITFGASSLEIEAFAAPKTMGLWNDMRDDLLVANDKATQKAGVFGTEVMLPVTIKGGRTVMTRVVGIDGPRWMLRGVFSGRAAVAEGPETDALNKFFADIVVERGDEPLAPRDLIPMHPPVTPKQRRAAEQHAPCCYKRRTVFMQQRHRLHRIDRHGYRAQQPPEQRTAGQDHLPRMPVRRQQEGSAHGQQDGQHLNAPWRAAAADR